MTLTPFHSLSAAEQLVEHLRQGILSGELSGVMPGIRKLASSLGVSPNTVIEAIGQLEREGFLEPQGHGRRSRIMFPKGVARPAFRVTLLPYERADIHLDYVIEIQRRLKEEGYDVHVTEKSLMDMRLDVGRISRMANRTKTDAWVVISAPREILEWFVKHSVPTFALFGRFRRLPMAGIGLDKVPAFRAAVRRLVELGHRRIVMLQPKHNRLPEPALLVRETLEEMEAHGIRTSPYNIPDWEPNPKGLWQRLDSLFAVSPPTAIILDRGNELMSTQQYLAQKGLFAPRDLSLISDDNTAFRWCDPPISCIQWPKNQWERRVINWVGNVAKGKDDRRKVFVKARFIEKGTVGPAPVKHG
jgi:DNA-binding LacI/PurR family transcriptional regulator